ncbi:MAG: choice-of-anchor J domain-containing protein [Cytophagaceae bacterium]|nr:choice-of-anchor J domain-containing protein [Cytophagaceae bacterium]MDW8455412.1 choice-of-anchor J domain-containing protein [Cytophagaceae bacterium]
MQRLGFLLLLIGIYLMSTNCVRKTEDALPEKKSLIPGLSQDKSLPFKDDFNYGTTVAEYGIPKGWYEALVEGSKTDRGWAYRNARGKNNTGGMIASAYGGNTGTDNTYLVTGPFNFDAFEKVYMKFDVVSNFGSGPGSLSVKYSTNYKGEGDPEAAGTTWSEITDINAELPATDNVWTCINKDISFINGSAVYIAFHYKDGTNTNSKQWTIDNVEISNQPINCAPPPPTLALPFLETFNYGTSLANFSIPNGWLEKFVAGSKTDRGWAYRSDLNGPTGNTDDDIMVASANAGAAGTDNVYLILGPIDFDAYSTDSLLFDCKREFGTNNGFLVVKYSTNYSPDMNDPEANASWSEIMTITSQLPTTDGTWKKIKASLEGISGKGYIGFHFFGATNSSSKRFSIDNVNIKF